ncbi:heme-binding-like protein At3g10130, chloroplastic [Nymphaea colorata]|nr:heme-binding-like protein At3g10130, chloroplastic [Nymphaea colorata]
MGGAAAIFDLTSSPLVVVDRWHRERSSQLGGGRRGTAPLFIPSATVVRTAATSSAVDDAASARKGENGRTPPSPIETRLSLVAALASQAFSASQRRLADLAVETWRYAFPRRMADARNLEEMLMSVPDLETVPFKVVSRKEQYEIREVEAYYVAETTMTGNKGFDFTASSQAFNVLAAYLFGKNTVSEKMEMTTPVYVQRGTQSDGEKMDMTTPVITKELTGQDGWKMSFVMPSKYGGRLPFPKDSSVQIKEVPRKFVAVSAFSGFVTDEEVKRRERQLRTAVKNDKDFQFKDNSAVEIAQFNPPFTLPFMRRNEIALEVEPKNV